MPFGGLAREIVEVDAVAPAAVIAAAARRAGRWTEVRSAAGRLSHAEDAPRADEATPFDLASVTKPVTALLVARLVRRGLLAWTTPLGALLEEARGTASDGVSIELLLAHRAGLDGHRPLYAPLVAGSAVDRAAALAEAASARRDGCDGDPPEQGFSPLYSDLGYLLVGAALERVANAPLDDLVAREVAAPLDLALGSARTLRARDARFSDRVAPTEIVPWRGGTIAGAVHDENAWAMAGDGSCGHAGLFGTASDVLALGCAILDAMAGRRDEFLGADEMTPLVRPRPGGTLRAGFDGKSAEGSSAGALFGPRTIGHLGFTGTSFWVDPDRDLAGVLLTNRVHPTRAADAIRRVRPKVYDAIARWADRSGAVC